jgi:hypothetical protein
MDLRVGDKVRCISDSYESFGVHIDCVYEIERINDNFDNFKLKNIEGAWSLPLDKRGAFELVEGLPVKIGDRVKILGKLGDYEGSKLGWVDFMNRCVGKIGTIINVDPLAIRVQFDDTNSWNFLPESLELVKAAEEKEQAMTKKVRNFDSFQAGHWYIYTGTKREDRWNDEGGMDYVLDHKPVKCVIGDGLDAQFEGYQLVEYDHRTWYWKDGFDNWIEIEDPNKQHVLTYGEKYYNISLNHIDSSDRMSVRCTGKPFYALKSRSSPGDVIMGSDTVSFRYMPWDKPAKEEKQKKAFSLSDETVELKPKKKNTVFTLPKIETVKIKPKKLNKKFTI